MAVRLPDNQADREVYLRDHDAGRFIATVSKVHEDADTVIMTVEAFAGEPEALYVALDYRLPPRFCRDAGGGQAGLTER